MPGYLMEKHPEGTKRLRAAGKKCYMSIPLKNSGGGVRFLSAARIFRAILLPPGQNSQEWIPACPQCLRLKPLQAGGTWSGTRWGVCPIIILK